MENEGVLTCPLKVPIGDMADQVAPIRRSVCCR